MTFDEGAPLFGPAAIRKRPGMYVGDVTDGSGLHNMIFGILDFVLYGTRESCSGPVWVLLEKDGVCTILGDPRPEFLSITRKLDIPAIQMVLNTINGAGMLRPNPYGDEERGAEPFCVNALSDWLNFRMTFDDKEHVMAFVNGELSLPLQVISDARIGGVQRAGLEISFRPRSDIFTLCDFDAQMVITGMRERGRRLLEVNLIFVDARGDDVRRHEI